MKAYQQDFIDCALACEVLRFGSFTLKSGRVSPYFFNAGQFTTGLVIKAVARCYAEMILESGIEFDLLFGPAYKGIPLVTATAMELSTLCGKSIPFSFNRKEVKAHGEGGMVVGAPLEGKVLILDDVISAGTAIRESIQFIHDQGATVSAAAVAIDRQEICSKSDRRSACAAISEIYKIPVLSVITLSDVIAHVANQANETGDASVLSAMEGFQQQYGIEAAGQLCKE